jgi:O-antigen/teichoic acid export membrane protein
MSATTAPANVGLIRAIATLGGIRFVSVAAGFATNLIAARALGASAFGVVGVALSIATLASILGNAGMNISAIYYLRMERDARRLMPVIVSVGLIGGAVAAVLVVAALSVVGTFVLPGQSRTVDLIAAALAATILWFELSGGLLLGVGLERDYMLAQLVEIGASLILTVLLVQAGFWTAEAYLGVLAIAYLLGVAYALERGRVAGPLRPAWDWPFVRLALGMGLRGQVGNVLTYLNLRLDLLLVPSLVGAPAAGTYFVATRIAEVISQVVASAGTMLFPHVATRGDRAETADTTEVARLSAILVACGALLVAAVAPVLIDIAFGREFTSGVGATRILLVGMVPLTVLRLLAGDSKGRGRAGLVSIAAGVSLAGTIVGDLLLIPVFGIEGAAAVSVVAYTLGVVVLVEAMRRHVALAWKDLLPRPADVRTLRQHALLILDLGRSRARSGVR